MKIFIGITTYDRPEYMEKMIASLSASNHVDLCSVNVFDDCSPHWDLDYLKEIFPEGTNIMRNNENMGSDENIRKMFIHFLQSDEDVLIAADSDLIFHPDWIQFTLSNLPKTDGIFSLYNSVCHPVINDLDHDPIFVEKEHMGSAGVVMTKDIVRQIIENVPESAYYDWDWSRHLFNNNIRLLVTEKSQIQHLGVHGYNNEGPLADVGLGFVPGSTNNEKWNMETLESIIKIQRKELSKVLA